MGIVDCLPNKVEPLAVLFWALGIVHCTVYLPTPDPARRPGITPLPYTKHALIWSYCLYGEGEVITFSTKTPCPPPFSI